MLKGLLNIQKAVNYKFYVIQLYFHNEFIKNSKLYSKNYHNLRHSMLFSNWIYLFTPIYHKIKAFKIAAFSSDITSILKLTSKRASCSLRRLTMTTMQKPEVLFVLGGPGSGKGTTCAQIVERTGYVHLSAGDLLREERAKPGSEFGEIIETHIRNGTIVPVEITCSLLDRAMQTSPNPHKRFLIDGFPRNQDNLDGWTKTMTDKTIVKAVLFLECSQEVCTQRCINRGLKGSGRSDDNPESLKKRHETFLHDTMPIVKYYEERGLVYKFNSMKPPKKVTAEVFAKLKKIGWIDDIQM